MIFLHNASKQETRGFTSIDNISAELSKENGWEVATQSQIDAYKLEKLKQDAKPILETQRKKEQYESITYNGKTYWATQTAQNNIGFAVLKILVDILLAKGIITDADWSAIATAWSDINRKKIELNGLDLNKIFDGIFSKSQTLYLQEDEKQNIVKDAVNVSQIEAVLPAGSYTPSMPTNEAPNGSFNTQLEPASGLENGGGELSKVQN